MDPLVTYNLLRPYSIYMLRQTGHKGPFEEPRQMDGLPLLKRAHKNLGTLNASDPSFANHLIHSLSMSIELHSHLAVLRRGPL